MGGESSAWAAPCKRLEAQFTSTSSRGRARFSSLDAISVTLQEFCCTRDGDSPRSSRNLRESGLELGRDPRPGGRIAEAFGADRDQRRAGVDAARARRGRWPRRPCRRSGSRRARRRARPARARPCGSPGPRGRRCRRRATGPSRPARARRARSVLISDTASAPPASAPAAHAATSAVLGVSLTISGLALQRAQRRASSASSSRGSAPMSSPVATFGHDTLSSIAATCVARPRAPRRARRTPRRSTPSRW